MKKIFAVVAMFGILSFGLSQTVVAQEEVVAQTETVDSAAVDSAAVDAVAADEEAPVVAEEETVGMHKALKTQFIEGDARFMSLVAIALVLGLAFCIERIIYLSLAEVNTKKLMAAIEAALAKGDVEGAKELCRNTRGPVASICYQGLLRIDEGLDVVERSVVSYGGVQSAALEKNCSWHP